MCLSFWPRQTFNIKHNRIFDQQSVYNPFYTKTCTCNNVFSQELHKKKKKNEPHLALIPYAVPYAVQQPTPDLYSKGGPMTG